MRGILVTLCLTVLPVAMSPGQQSAETGAARVPTGLGRGNPDTPRYFASAAAATRAIAICSGLWSANQTMADIDRYSPLHPEDAGHFETEIDGESRTVSITYDPDMPPRIVVWRPVLGCTQLPVGARPEAKNPLPQVAARIRTPELDEQPWPLGDRDAVATLPRAQQSKLDDVVDGAFDGTTYPGNTWGVVVVVNGKIAAERYAMNFDMHKGAQTHSAAKSFAASLLGIAVRQYGMNIHAPGALEAWRRPGDPRNRITVNHLLRMNSGLYGEGNGSPQADIYSNGATVAERAVTNFLHTMPGSRFVYNPPDTMLLVRAIREVVNDDEKFLAMPFTELFWKLGMTRTTPSSDWNGDFLMSGQTYSTARDFARFGLLYLGEGVFNGERILPEGWDRLVSTPELAQPSGDGPGYGGQFWLYGGHEGLPDDAFAARGGMGQYIMIVRSQDLVIVRRGYDVGASFPLDKFSADIIGALQ
ncbi:MAG: serine hydrolase [Gammaproteobacteria bacterium]